MTRRCAQCHGPVSHSYTTTELPNPADPTGYDKITVRGLGHWRCTKGCKPRIIQVTRYVGAGKEDERINRNLQASLNNWRDEYMRSVSVRRDIAVITYTRTDKAKEANA